MKSAIYIGKVWHQRIVPIQHQFSYRIFMFWLDLKNINDIPSKVLGFSVNNWAICRYLRSDYLGDANEPLHISALTKMSELAGTTLVGEVFLLAQVRMFGVYFSPVNFYYLRQGDGHFSHMLAEVSNTPWNERHYYLVDLSNQIDSQKDFHVSPFNPMEMHYQWDIKQPEETLRLSMKCIKDSVHFAAGIKLQKLPLNSKTFFRVLIKIPSMTLTTVGGIYWQAFKLWLKKAPIYEHPGNKDKEK